MEGWHLEVEMDGREANLPCIAGERESHGQWTDYYLLSYNVLAVHRSAWERHQNTGANGGVGVIDPEELVGIINDDPDSYVVNEDIVIRDSDGEIIGFREEAQ